MERPAGIFDREWEWDSLVRFIEASSAGATLGVVSGRRRQGKSFLLRALCEAAGGFYYQGVRAQSAEALRHFGSHLAAFSGSPAPLAFSDWRSAVDSLAGLGADRPGASHPMFTVLDEFPYIADGAPVLPSILQSAIDERAAVGGGARIILCGSAMAFMGKLLSGSAPLRGRAGMELVVQPFSYRQAAAFWGLSRQPELALKVHAIVGGTPAYRREFIGGDAPTSLGDFDSWVQRGVLNPALPLFREGRYLLAEESGVRDPALYHSILAAIGEGKATRGGIASSIQRPSTDIGHPLSVLEDIALVRRDDDPLRPGRPIYRIVEPLVVFYHTIIRPAYGQLEAPGGANRVWPSLKARFSSQILGPHFEEVCRTWTLHFADLQEPIWQVGASVINDPRQSATHEVDVVAVAAQQPGALKKVLLLGEAKWGGASRVELAKLRRVLDLLGRRKDLDVSQCRLALFSATGFASGIAEEFQGTEVLLVDANRLFSEA